MYVSVFTLCQMQMFRHSDKMNYVTGFALFVVPFTHNPSIKYHQLKITTKILSADRYLRIYLLCADSPYYYIKLTSEQKILSDGHEIVTARLFIIIFIKIIYYRKIKIRSWFSEPIRPKKQQFFCSYARRTKCTYRLNGLKLESYWLFSL